MTAIDITSFDLWDEIAKRFEPNVDHERYFQDPVSWGKEKLGVELWSKQEEITKAVRDNKRTAVRSAHDVGKSFIAAFLACWWIDTHPPGEAFVVSTAPTYKQVNAILWEEIRKNHKRYPDLPGAAFRSDEWKLDDGTLVGYGRTIREHDEHGFQGLHRRYVLVIIDEACGVVEQVWTAIEAITTNDDSRILAIGNPDDPNTEFGKVSKPGSGWTQIRISAFDSPNFTKEPVNDNLSALLISEAWVEDKKKRWGENSPLFISKVNGEFPDIGENTLISPSLIEAAQNREIFPTAYSQLGVDVARFGMDRTVLALNKGGFLRIIGDYAKKATTETTGHVVAEVRERKISEVRVDGVGIGAGVVDQLVEQGYSVADMQSGRQAFDSIHFANARAEWYWGLRQMFEEGLIDLDPEDDELASQLGSLKYKYRSNGQILIESKDDMRKRGMPSPDLADAAMLCTAWIPPELNDTLEDEDFYDDLEDYSISPY